GVGSSYRGIAGIVPEQLANRELSWETTSQFNAGLDAALLRNRLTTSFNYYYKYTKDGLLTEILPGTTGFSSFTNNAVGVSSRGLELSGSSVYITNAALSGNAAFHLARSRNGGEKRATPDSYGSRNVMQCKDGRGMYSL